MFKVVHYLTPDGDDPFESWLMDQSLQVQARILTRLSRVELGNLGDHEGVGEGVSELRIHFGPGYRVYYGLDGGEMVVLLGGGTKRRQTRDIRDARGRWRDYRRRRDARQGPQDQ